MLYLKGGGGQVLKYTNINKIQHLAFTSSCNTLKFINKVINWWKGQFEREILEKVHFWQNETLISVGQKVYE